MMLSLHIHRAIERLQSITMLRDGDDHLPFVTDVFKNRVLDEAVQSLDAVVSDNLPPSLTDKAHERWSEYISGNQVSFAPREIRCLCWISEVVGHERFIGNILDGSFYVGGQAIKALLNSYHANFTQLCLNRELETFLFNRLSHFEKSDPRIRKWLGYLDALLGQQAPSRLGVHIRGSSKSIESFAKEIGILEESPFLRLAARHCVESYTSDFGKLNDPQRNVFLFSVLSSPLIEQETLKETLASLILDPEVNRNEALQGLIIDFCMKKEGFGDPRINPWTGVRDEATQRFIQWLSREDINFFFELLIKDREDRHNRKSFWLEYVPVVKRSRALLCPSDRKKHAVKLKDLEERGRSYGELQDNNDTCCFILDFGELVVVEFNQIGNACYMYRRREFDSIVQNFWKAGESIHTLKNAEKALERITRSVRDWKSNTRTILSRNGIRRA